MLFSTQIVAHRTAAQGTHEVTFGRPDSFEFNSGQYTQVAVPQLTTPDPKGRCRQFSLASSPDDRKHLKVVFRDSGSGFKKTLIGAPIGSEVTVESAGGSFLLPSSIQRPHVFVAGGVGVAPFMSYLTDQTCAGATHPITLIYGNRNTQSAAYLGQLKLMATKHENFTLHDTYERPTPELFCSFTTQHPDAVWWVVGPPAMVGVTVSGLRSGGILPSNIITESFDGY